MRGLGTILMAGTAMVACSSGASDLAPEPRVPLIVKKATFQSRLALSGSLVAETSISINAPGDGYGLVIRWMAPDGSEVKKGDKVLEIDTSAVVSQIESLKSAVIKANNALASEQNKDQMGRAEKTHLLRQAEFARKKAQVDANVPADAYPRRVYEDMQLALERAKAAHKGATLALAMEKKVGKNGMDQKRIDLARSERDLARVYEKLEGYVLHAPRDGVLAASDNWREGRAYRLGDKTWPGQPVVEIPDLSVMNVEANLSDVDDGQVKVGMKTECRLDAYPDDVFTGRVVSISPVARKARRNSLRQVFNVTVKLDSTDAALMRPGMSARVEILGSTRENVLVAPRKALRFDQGNVTARLESGKQQEVTLGPCNPSECVVQSGLSEGSRLQEGGSQ
ncbi:MAG: HlyD family efflux transporter periplasmic adaptor subunit [Myxococcales bacterium]|nr:HlyD family efflux transporter periplasmic adaptor subunit [Myxococcales bacterium]